MSVPEVGRVVVADPEALALSTGGTGCADSIMLRTVGTLASIAQFGAQPISQNLAAGYAETFIDLSCFRHQRILVALDGKRSNLCQCVCGPIEQACHVVQGRDDDVSSDLPRVCIEPCLRGHEQGHALVPCGNKPVSPRSLLVHPRLTNTVV